MLKCAWRGSAHAPTLVPEASIPQVVTPTGQDDGCNFSVGFIARRYVGRGRGLPLQGASLKAGMVGKSLAWVLKLSAWPPQMVL